MNDPSQRPCSALKWTALIVLIAALAAVAVVAILKLKTISVVVKVFVTTAESPSAAWDDCENMPEGPVKDVAPQGKSPSAAGVSEE